MSTPKSIAAQIKTETRLLQGAIDAKLFKAAALWVESISALVQELEKVTEDEDGFDADFEAWVDRKEYEDSLVYGGTQA